MKTNELLKEFGFTEYETKVYLALAKLSTAKASDIARESTVPPNKVYECLIKLAEKGFIASLNVTPRKYKIIGVQKFRDILSEKQNSMKVMQKGVSELQKLLQTKAFDVQQNAIVLKGKDKIMQMLNEITPTLTKYQYNFAGSLTFNHTSARLIKEAIKRGVDFRFLVHKDPTRLKVYEKWRKVGVKIRFYPKMEQKSIRFSAFDDLVCRTTIGRPEIYDHENYISFWVESAAFTSLLKDQFLSMWNRVNE